MFESEDSSALTGWSLIVLLLLWLLLLLYLLEMLHEWNGDENGGFVFKAVDKWGGVRGGRGAHEPRKFF